MPDNKRECSGRVTMICIDSYHDSVPSGMFYDPCLERTDEFRGLTQFLTKMDAFLNDTETVQTDGFSEEDLLYGRHSPTSEYRLGKIATFAMRVLFRENSSWQGTITWMEGKTERNFRSVMEFVHLLDSAIEEQQAKENPDLIATIV